MVELESGVSEYIFIDGSGTTEHWYRTTFFDETSVLEESAFSASFRGTFTDTNFTTVSYPEEAVFTSSDRYTVDRIRNLTGDPKSLNRDYVSCNTGYSSMSEDGYTHTLTNPNGWPVKIERDGVEYTSIDQPVVNDYQFVSFSGIQINTVSGVLDVWYYHFRNSDAELLRVFNGLIPPPQLEPEQVTFDLAAICAAIEVLEGELRLFGVDSGSEVDIFQEIRIDPSGGFGSRLKDLAALRARKKELIDSILEGAGGINRDLYGVLID
jgi:hypothetical protein